MHLTIIFALLLFLAAAPAAALKNVILIGWDGADRKTVLDLAEKKLLPNLSRLGREGSFIALQVAGSRTETKPGWAEILTGLPPSETRVVSNLDYAPIPPGLTLFEQLRAQPGGAAVFTALLAGKSFNLGARGPHEICLNCVRRDAAERRLTFFYDREKFSGPTLDKKAPDWAAREGEPYFHAARSMNKFRNGLGSADSVGRAALALLAETRDRPFFLFFHFEDPDEAGHRRGASSREYRDAIIRSDVWLGRLRRALKAAGLESNTEIYVVTDHGMGPDEYGHPDAPDIFLACTRPGLVGPGNRRDVGATLAQALGLEPWPPARAGGRPLGGHAGEKGGK